MDWVDSLLGATGWQQPRWECDWSETEAALGTELPADYKKICACFGPGYFSSYFNVLPDAGRDSLLDTWRFYKRGFEEAPARWATVLNPYKLYGHEDDNGLILWGRSEMEGAFYWLADSSIDPDTWPVVARLDPIEEWYRIDMPTSEFLYRAVTDSEFAPVAIAHLTGPPSFDRPTFFTPGG